MSDSSNIKWSLSVALGNIGCSNSLQLLAFNTCTAFSICDILVSYSFVKSFISVSYLPVEFSKILVIGPLYLVTFLVLIKQGLKMTAFLFLSNIEGRLVSSSKFARKSFSSFDLIGT